MATPERRTAPSAPAHAPGHGTQATTPSGPVPVLAPLGWVLILSAAIGLIVATWLLYGNEAPGMWAGYRDGFIGTVVILCAMGLNTSLPKQPLLALIGLAGVLLVLFSVFIDDGRTVFISELVSGAVMLAGVGMYAAGRKS
jgi:hypothetical protein